MHVFVTGASGFIGTAVLPELIAAGHRVTGLARNTEGAERVRRAGGEPVIGDLNDPAALAELARQADGVIHLAFIHEFDKFEQNILIDRAAVEAMTAALAGSGKAFVLTSGVALAGRPGEPATEEDRPSQMRVGNASRGETEDVVRAASGNGVRGIVVRLPQVHGDSELGFKAGMVSPLIEIVRARGFAAYIDDGSEHRWAAAYRGDVARLYALAFDKGQPGAVFHAVGEEGVPQRAIVETIGANLGLPVRGIPADDAGDYFGWLQMFAGMDNLASSAITRRTLGWQPTGPGLIEDMARATL